MLFSYLKLSFRLMMRNPFFTFINVAGLSVGFAVFFVLWQYSSYELNSDQYHKDHNRIFRLYGDFYQTTWVDQPHYLFGAFPPSFTPIAEQKFTEIESTTRIIHQQNFEEVRWVGPQTDSGSWSQLSRTAVFSIVDKTDRKHSFIEEDVAYADPNVFQFFSIPLVAGEASQVLSRADAIVISSSAARKYFGQEDPMGKLLTLNDTSRFTVTGVFKDLPLNTHLKFDMVMSTLRIANAIVSPNPFQRSTHNYFKLNAGADVKALEAKLNEEHKIHWDWKERPGAILTVILQPLREVPYVVFDNDFFAAKSKSLLLAFAWVSIVVLGMASINYLNLKLSSQAARMKELSTRKTVGAKRYDFIQQFLVESIAINGLSILVALTLIQLMRQPLEVLFQFYLPSWNELTPSTVLIFCLVMIISILVAGLQPALLSWSKTTRKMMIKPSAQSINVTAITSVTQFVTAIALIVWLFSVSGQVDFLMQDSWGLNRDRVIIVEMPRSELDFTRKIQSLKREILAMPSVEDATLSTVVAGDWNENAFSLVRPDTSGFVVPRSDGGVDERFIPFYGLKMLAGRNFLPDNPADYRAVIISRIVAQNIGWTPEQAVGKSVTVEKFSWRPFQAEAVVIGVVDEHRHSPLYTESGFSKTDIGNILTYGNYLRPGNRFAKMSVRFGGQLSDELLSRLQQKYSEVFPDEIFRWYFLDEHMNGHYQYERAARNQIILFTLIAIGIACLGLLGMISNKTVEKTKEIGIRKVLGAARHQIAQILLQATVSQIAIASVIGIPIAHLLTQQYLQQFSERIDLQWWHFVLPVIMLVLIMMATVLVVIWKAAVSNPVEALKHE